MDAFYASVEQLDNPKLIGKCVVVGGMSNRGVVSAASYEARAFGVRSAMPIYKAKQICPDAVFLPPRMKRYKELSERIITILKSVSPLVEPVSIDEAYVDITGCERLYGNPLRIATRIKQEIQNKIHLKCSIGVAPNKLLAKVASDMDKPNGLKIILPEEVPDFIKTLPVSKVPGVGKKLNKQLTDLGIQCLGDLNLYAEDALRRRLGKFGERLIELSACVDRSQVVPESERKSVSCEETLREDTWDALLLEKCILRFSGTVGKELRRLDVRAKTIHLKIKHSDFRQIARSVTIQHPTNSSETIFHEAKKLLKKYRLTSKVRLIGVGASGFIHMKTYSQMSLFTDSENKDGHWECVDSVVDTIEKKYGDHIISRASLRK